MYGRLDGVVDMSLLFPQPCTTTVASSVTTVTWRWLVSATSVGKGRTSIITIIIIVEMTVFYVAGYLIEERRGWPEIYCLPMRTIFLINSEFLKKGTFR